MLEVVQKEKHGIDSILVCRNGYLILDAYMYPFQKNQKHVIHSCTKSFTSALVGIAIDKGSIKSVNTPVLEFFPEITPANPHADKKRITLEHVLMMASGLECRDSWKYYWQGLRAIRQSADWTKFMLDLPMTDTPGTAFEYCNGGPIFFRPSYKKLPEKPPLITPGNTCSAPWGSRTWNGRPIPKESPLGGVKCGSSPGTWPNSACFT